MVRKIGLVMMAALLACTAGYSAPVLADSGVEDTPLMNLFPTQRTAHQQQIEATGFAYHDRGAAYVANLYDNHAEKDLEEDNSLLFLEGGDVNPKPVDIEEVASIIKESEAASAPTDTAASK